MECGCSRAGCSTGEALVRHFHCMLHLDSKKPGHSGPWAIMRPRPQVELPGGASGLLLGIRSVRPPHLSSLRDSRHSTKVSFASSSCTWCGGFFVFTKISVAKIPPRICAASIVTAGFCWAVDGNSMGIARPADAADRVAPRHHRGLFMGIHQQWLEYLVPAISPSNGTGVAQRHFRILDAGSGCSTARTKKKTR